MAAEHQMIVNKGKDAAPEQTVRRIQEILKRHGFEARYEAQEPQLGTCYFSRVSVNEFGSNGKGMSPEFCMASGYAELMERMQNRVMSVFARHDSPYTRKLAACFPTSDLKGDNHPCVANILRRLVQSAAATGLSPEDATRQVEELLSSLALEGKYILRPFYSVDEGKEVLLPVTFLQLFSGSNGMAAGNTLEEAIVQGLSEVFERFATIQILFRNLTPPEIPRSFLQTHHPKIVEIIDTIETDPDYRVTVLDASLGREIPCVACVIHNRKTLSFGVKFGAYPSMEIALERCFSEAVQGWKLLGFSKAGAITYSPMGRASWVEILNILKISKGVYPSSLLAGTPAWEFTPWREDHCTTNTAMLRQQLAVLKKLNRSVYIQDVSFLGFPSVYIFVPEMSEITPVDILWLQERYLALKAQDIFARSDTASDSEIEQLLTACRIKRGSILENTVDRMAGTAFEDPMPGAPNEMEFLCGVCHYRLGNDKQALQCFQSTPNTPHNLAIIHYLTARLAGKTEAEAGQLLWKLTQEAVANKVIDAFADRKQVFRKLYPYCDGNCAHCQTRCKQPRIQADYEKLLAIECRAGLGAENLIRLFAAL